MEGRGPATNLGAACREAMALSPVDTMRKLRRFAALMAAIEDEPGDENDRVWRYAIMTGIAQFTIERLIARLDALGPRA